MDRSKGAIAMMVVECPWCAGSATVEVAEGGDTFECRACAVQVEIAPLASSETVARAA
jgi:sarcosine oxidase delta subunit